jgi:hypothetical protein
MNCPHCQNCQTEILTGPNSKIPDRYDYVVVRCSSRSCRHEIAILIVALKRLDPIKYGELVAKGFIDPRYNVIRQLPAA